MTINTVLNYDESSQAAGTGMILNSNGTVLTNNHVIQGATSITVTDETTGKEYKADVVGTDATNDVAVLKLEDASGLSTVTLDDDGEPSTGDTVTDVGNAEGTGNLVAAEGTVTATDQDIQVQSESGTGTESLSGLIEIAANIVSGDSGGPVVDSEGEVVGMATAASSGTADVTGYAIPITTAKAIAEKILAGESSSTITIGLPAFLGSRSAAPRAPRAASPSPARSRVPVQRAPVWPRATRSRAWAGPRSRPRTSSPPPCSRTPSATRSWSATPTARAPPRPSPSP